MVYFIINHLSVVSKHTEYDFNPGAMYVSAKMGLQFLKIEPTVN